MRRRDPQRVRRALIDGTAALTIEHGLANVSVAAVAASAGVTKGALFHHFADRDALIGAMFRMLLERVDEQIERLMAVDPHVHGRFTRAYVDAALKSDGDDRRMWAALIGVLVGGGPLTQQWYRWLDESLARHPSEHDPMLEVVRLAADGAWLCATTGATSIDRTALRARLFDLTLPAREAPIE